jgi:hypothetical protein
MTKIFVYSKDGVIKVLSNHNTFRLYEEEKNLLSQGWKHTSTLDPCRFLEYLCNESQSIEVDVKALLR